MGNKRVMGFVWLAVRLWLGYQWVTAGFEKVFGAGRSAWVGEKAGVAVTGFLKGAVAKAAEGDHPEVHGWYASFATHVAIPNATVFSHLVAYGELLVGIALLLGVVTQFALVMGILMNYSYVAAGSSSSNPEMIIVALVLLLGARELVSYYGVDRWLMPWLKAKLGLGRTPAQALAPHTARGAGAA